MHVKRDKKARRKKEGHIQLNRKSEESKDEGMIKGVLV